MNGIKLAASAFGVLALLTACADDGGDDGDGDSGFAEESAADIQAAAIEDTQAIESVHLAGTVTQGDGEIGLDISMNTDGDCDGTVSRGEDGEAQVTSLDGTSWFKPDEAFWRAQAGPQADQILALVGDKWVLLPEGDQSFSSFCDLDQLLGQIGEDPETTEKGDTEDVDGEEAVQLTRKGDDGGTITAWVAVDDPHHILKIEQSGGDGPGSFTFSEFDEEVDVEPPGEDEVVDLSQLQP